MMQAAAGCGGGRGRVAMCMMTLAVIGPGKEAGSARGSMVVVAGVLMEAE